MAYDLQGIYNKATALGMQVLANSWLVAVKDNNDRYMVYTNKQTKLLTYDIAEVRAHFAYLANISHQNNMPIEIAILCEFSDKIHFSNMLNIHTLFNESTILLDPDEATGRFKYEYWLGDPHNSNIMLVQQLGNDSFKLKKQFIINKLGNIIEVPIKIYDMRYDSVADLYRIRFKRSETAELILNSNLDIIKKSDNCKVLQGYKGRIKIHYTGGL